MNNPQTLRQTLYSIYEQHNQLCDNRTAKRHAIINQTIDALHTFMNEQHVSEITWPLKDANGKYDHNQQLLQIKGRTSRGSTYGIRQKEDTLYLLTEFCDLSTNLEPLIIHFPLTFKTIINQELVPDDYPENRESQTGEFVHSPTLFFPALLTKAMGEKGKDVILALTKLQEEIEALDTIESTELYPKMSQTLEAYLACYLPEDEEGEFRIDEHLTPELKEALTFYADFWGLSFFPWRNITHITLRDEICLAFDEDDELLGVKDLPLNGWIYIDNDGELPPAFTYSEDQTFFEFAIHLVEAVTLSLEHQQSIN